jgi:hypothetical protein
MLQISMFASKIAGITYYADMLDREGKVLDVQQVGFTQQTVDA